MRSLFFLLSFLMLGCANEVNNPQALQELRGTYSGSFPSSEGEVFIDLKLDHEGFYRIQHSDLSKLPSFEIVKDEGVFILKDSLIDLARNVPGYRYFRIGQGGIDILSLEGEPHSFPGDTNYRLRKVEKDPF